jgi:hypothetical protein
MKLKNPIQGQSDLNEQADKSLLKIQNGFKKDYNID